MAPTACPRKPKSASSRPTTKRGNIVTPSGEYDLHPSIGGFAVRNSLALLFIVAALCLAGVYSAVQMPSSVFPQTNFPRCVVLVDNGVMPADEMMATVTRPIEEAMKDIPGAVSVRSATGRGSAEISVFFDWHRDMVQSEL